MRARILPFPNLHSPAERQEVQPWSTWDVALMGVVFLDVLWESGMAIVVMKDAAYRSWLLMFLRSFDPLAWFFLASVVTAGLLAAFLFPPFLQRRLGVGLLLAMYVKMALGLYIVFWAPSILKTIPRISRFMEGEGGMIETWFIGAVWICVATVLLFIKIESRPPIQPS